MCLLMIEKEKQQISSSKLPNTEWSQSLQALYETARQLSLEEKAQFIRKLIDTSEMSLSLRVEITGSSKMTILNLNLDSREKIAQAVEIAASKLDQVTTQENSHKASGYDEK